MSIDQANTVTFTTSSPKAVAKGLRPENWAYPSTIGIGSSLSEYAAIYGETPVYNLAVAQHKIVAQNVIRRMAEAGKSDDEITTLMNTWKPGDKVLLDGGSVMDRAMTEFALKTPEEQAEIIAELNKRRA